VIEATMHGVAIARREWTWLAFAGALVLLLASLPILAGGAVSQPDRVLGGMVLHLPDGYSYLAKMRLGADGAWLFRNRYAVEPHPPILLYEHYLVLGKLAGASPNAALAVYHLARVVCGSVLLMVAYRFVSMLLADVGQRRLAWLLIALGGGLGWLLIALTGEALPFGAPPLDLNLGEAFSFVALTAIPHTLFARSALLLGVMWFARAVDRNERRYLLAAALAWLLAAIGVPFDIVVAGGVVAGVLLVRWLRTRRAPWREAILGVLAGLPGVMWVVVSLLMMGGNEVYAQWAAQNTFELPHPLHLASAFGVPLVLAVFGARRAWQEQRPYTDVFIGWCVASPLLALLPVGVQLRLIEGFSIPLFALAVLGLDALRARPVVRRAAGVALVGVLLPSTLLLSLGGTGEVLLGSERLFIAGDAIAAFAWLDAHAPAESVLLSSERVGLIAPSRAPVRAVIGHAFETPYYARKSAEVAAFFGSGMSDADRRELLARYGVRYVWLGPDERALGGFDPGTLSGLAPIFVQGSVTVYEVQR
jgi:hypothetical protein